MQPMQLCKKNGEILDDSDDLYTALVENIIMLQTLFLDISKWFITIYRYSKKNINAEMHLDRTRKEMVR